MAANFSGFGEAAKVFAFGNSGVPEIETAVRGVLPAHGGFYRFICRVAGRSVDSIGSDHSKLIWRVEHLGQCIGEFRAVYAVNDRSRHCYLPFKGLVAGLSIYDF